jgi:hypothetical protein
VNVPTGQAIAIDAVDFIIQQGGAANSQELQTMLVSSGCLSFQLSDLNPGTLLVRADDQSLIASGALNIDQPNNIGSEQADFYPDNFGTSSLSEAFMVVNDNLYLVAGVNGAVVGAGGVAISVRVRCRVVKLSQTDWMAIAIQATAND